MFDNIKNYCMFVGNSRSGTTLLGSLLNAHPNIAIAMKLDALQYIHKRIINSQKVLFSKLLQKSVEFVEQRNCIDQGYDYKTVGHYQGKFTELNVIGDNASGTSCIYLAKYPYLLDEMKRVVGLHIPIKFVYAIRNPFDVIASTYIHTRKRKKLNFTMHTAINDIFNQYKTMQWLEKEVGSDLYKIRHDVFIQNPKTELTKLCNFIGIETTNDYLDCIKIVNNEPHYTRKDKEVIWPINSIDYIQNKIKDFSFLDGYTFKN